MYIIVLVFFFYLLFSAAFSMSGKCFVFVALTQTLASGPHLLNPERITQQPDFLGGNGEQRGVPSVVGLT